MDAAKRFLEDLWDGTYVCLALRLDKLTLDLNNPKGLEASRPTELNIIDTPLLEVDF